MSGLRETKKNATRVAMSDAAAHIVVTEGAEALTVAAVAERAGVSARTFHNYFASTAEALMWFNVDMINRLASRIETMDPQLTMADIFEHFLLEGLGDDGLELHTVATMFKVGEVIESTNPSLNDAACFHEHTRTFHEVFTARQPEHSAFEIELLLHLNGVAGIAAAKRISEEACSQSEAEEIIRNAFSILRSVT